MGILALPNEILHIILDLSRPYNFENLVLTCKRLYSASTPLLANHGRLRKRYRSFKFGSETVSSVPDLLREIAENPVIASYIVHADLGDRECLNEDFTPDNFPVDGPDALVALIRKSEHLAVLDDGGIDLISHWLNDIMEDVDEFELPVDFPVAFLLTLLNNVESLTLPKEWRKASAVGLEYSDPVDDINRSISVLLQNLVTGANNGALKDQPLHKLNTLYPTQDVDTQSGTDMESIFPFLALDSLRRLEHRSGIFEPGDDEKEIGCCEQYPVLGRNLEVIKLKDYVMNPNGALIFFKGMNRLRVLEFEYSMKDEVGYQFDVEYFLFCLAQNVGGHLEKLSLSVDQIWPDTGHIEFSSLRRFKVLEHLELDTAFFVNSTGSMGGMVDVEESEEEDSDEIDEVEDDEDGHDGDDNADNDSDNDSSDDGTWRLVNELPPTLQTLVIRSAATKRDVTCLERLFGGFAKHKEDKLPLLKEVRVHVRWHDCFGTELVDFQEHVDRARAFFGDLDFVVFHGP